MSHVQRIYLTDILDRIRRIEEYAAVERDEFINSELREDGVVRCFEVIGEVVKRLDPGANGTISRYSMERFRRNTRFPDTPLR